MASRKAKKKVPETSYFPQEAVTQEGRVGAMGMADDMRNLAQEIINSFDARVATRAALRQETATELKGFRQAMKDVQRELERKAADLRRFLGTAESSRRSDFRTMHQGIRAGQQARSRQVGGMLSGCREMMSGFRREREAAASHWQNMAATMAKRRASATR